MGGKVTRRNALSSWMGTRGGGQGEDIGVKKHGRGRSGVLSVEAWRG